ncbi:MAG: prolyl oligopeptidase family serine peptidase [Chloroflexota bacterium]|nr:prolyl oligopeptidase family serine peptidase [Chloroflexota bacterium]
MSISYPAARRADNIDVYHGVSVPDPYRWMEDETAPEVEAWIAAQNTITRAHLDAQPARPTLKARMTQLWNFPRWLPPTTRERGDGTTRYFFTLNDGLRNQPILYVQEGLNGTPRVLIDPNTFSADGTVALSGSFINEVGTLLAYLTSDGGSDEQTIHIRRVTDSDGASADDFAETLIHCRFAQVAWTPDSAGFYYNRYPDPATVAPEARQTNNQLYYHQLGTPQADDVLIYTRPDAPELNFSPEVTSDGRYLVLTVWHGAVNRNRLYYAPLTSDRRVTADDIVPLIDVPDASYNVIGSDGTTFYVFSDLDAPNGRVIAIDLDAPARDQWRTIIAEGAQPIDIAQMAGDRFVLLKLSDASSRLEVVRRDGTPERAIPLPTLGSIWVLTARQASDEVFYRFESFLYPPTIFRHVVSTGETAPFKTPELDFPVEGYETRQIFATSKDGTRVPAFLTHKRGLTLDGNNPVMLYAYGGFSVSLKPIFAVTELAWIEAGGVLAWANLRGGAEYGESWHQAGMGASKQNVFDDFVAVAEALIAQGVTRRERLAIRGGSNGGLLVAACVLQRPDLFGAAVAQVPVTDMLRYQRFTAGRYWVGEYGDAAASADDFAVLYAYSPLHNVEPADYPPTLITTAQGDDRVVPLHSYKFAAALQVAQTGDAPILLRVEGRAGHGQGKPVHKQIDEAADTYAFVFGALGVALV